MRIYLTTTKNEETIPFNYQHKLVGVIHKWLGKNNNEHGNISLYSFSWLMNGKMVKNGFNFSNGAKMFISFYNEECIKTIIKSIRMDPYMFCGLIVVHPTFRVI